MKSSDKLNKTRKILNSERIKGLHMKKQKEPPEVFYNKVSFLIKLQASGCKKKTLAQAFSSEFCKIFQNIFFTEHLWATAPEKQGVF